MKPILPIIIAVALVAAFMLSRPRAVTPNNSAQTLEVAPLTLSGNVLIPAQTGATVRVTAIADGQVIAESGLTGKRYTLQLPARVAMPQTKLDQVSLLHGDAHLPGEARATEISLVLYQDANKNAHYDPGEPKIEAELLPGGKDPNYQAFFKYKLLLLSGDSSLKTTEDNPTGAKNFYRYDINLRTGYNMLEGELASNGFDMRTNNGTNWDLLLPLPQAGNGGPPTFTP